MPLAACHRRPAPEVRTPAPGESKASPAQSPAGPPEFAVEPVATQEGEAVWYDVPDQSLPERRAWSGEMTAASDTLPQNAYVRVRRVDGGKTTRSVVVRITDKGLHRKDTLIDVDRQAAESLGMVKSGAVRVRVETLRLQHADADKPVDKKDATPTAAKITSTPAATRTQEKENAAAKAGGSTPP